MPAAVTTLLVRAIFMRTFSRSTRAASLAAMRRRGRTRSSRSKGPRLMMERRSTRKRRLVTSMVRSGTLLPIWVLTPTLW